MRGREAISKQCFFRENNSLGVHPVAGGWSAAADTVARGCGAVEAGIGVC